MRAQRNPYPVPSPVSFLLMVFLGGVEGTVIYLLHAPFWVFYVAPLAMGPLLVWELLHLDAKYRQEQKGLVSTSCS